MAFGEFLGRTCKLKFGNQGSNVLMLRSMLNDLLESDDLLSFDDNHLSNVSYDAITKAMVRNRVQLGKFDLVNMDLNPPTPKSAAALGTITTTFSEYFQSIANFPKFACPAKFKLNVEEASGNKAKKAKK
jgi:hypothetical protein